MYIAPSAYVTVNLEFKLGWEEGEELGLGLALANLQCWRVRASLG